MFYQFLELQRAALQPARSMADAMLQFYTSPLNPMADTALGRTIAAGAEIFERSTRHYGKPAFGIESVTIDGCDVAVREEVVWSRPFCRLLHFSRALPEGVAAGPKLFLLAPMSGHYATLLRGTVQRLLPHADIYITDWEDARAIPVSAGDFDLEDYVDYLIEMLRHLGPGVASMAVCQPSVPLLAALAVMSANGDRCLPSSMVLVGGPIDTRVNPTAVNTNAKSHDVSWFRDNVVMQVPLQHPGAGRAVYPGFMQLSGFLGMNPGRHLNAHQDFFLHLVSGAGESADRHRAFYDEFLAVMDLPAPYYLQTIERVFLNHDLPNGNFTHRGVPVDLKAIKDVALMTVEGELDDISGVGQTEAAHSLCSNIPQKMRAHHLQAGVGHYGVFHGTRFNEDIAPRILDFIAAYQG